MNYRVSILEESGYDHAMLGLSLSYNKPVHEMYRVARKLYNKDSGHNKFLESLVIWLDINMPRYWWSEFDTYRVGVTKQSESTMHTIFKKELTQKNFVQNIDQGILFTLNCWIKEYQTLKGLCGNYKEDIDSCFREIKNILPEGFLQRRVVCTNYKVLRHILKQRKNHRLREWTYFCNYIEDMCKYKEFIN